jgi:hypothetical protein
MTKFINECKDKPERFEEKIVANKVKNFAWDCQKTKMKTKDLKEVEVKFTRDLFGRLLYLSQAEDVKFNLEDVLNYPLTPVPLSMAHINGSWSPKSIKASFQKRLEKGFIVNTNIKFDVYLIDFMFDIRCFKEYPPTFGDLSHSVLSRALKLADTIHVVCDQYKSPSIKDHTHDVRGEFHKQYKISGPNQKLPGNLLESLKSMSFKKSLADFFAADWSSDRMKNVLKGHNTVYFTHNNLCMKIQVKYYN